MGIASSNNILNCLSGFFSFSPNVPWVWGLIAKFLRKSRCQSIWTFKDVSMHPKKESSRWWEKCSHTRHFKLWRSIYNYSLISICREGACAARETLCCNLSSPLSFSLSVFSPTKSLVSLFIRLDQYGGWVASGEERASDIPQIPHSFHSFLPSVSCSATDLSYLFSTHLLRKVKGRTLERPR